MSYPMIVTTLQEFGLITTEQAEQALAAYDREYAELQERSERFQREWNKSTPWWKKFYRSWVADFYAQERSQ